MPMLNTGGNSKTELTEVKSQLEQINSEKYDKVTLYENVLKFYANEVELTSITLPGFEGNGQNAREIELQKSETHIQWRYVGEEVWRDLVALNDIKGDAGDKGDKGDRGLPVSININEINYTHQDGIITLPNYPNKTSDLENDAGFITSADIDTTQNHVHTNKSSLDKITEQKLTSWDSKSDFSGSYNDLTDKPNIPSVVGLATESYVNTKVAGIVDSAPETLNTLNELSIALGNDPNFATTVANQIGTKADKSHNHNTVYASKSSEHNHANKTTLDEINDSKIANWNDAYTHSQIAHDYAHSTHDHNASQITEMTGYAKPSTTSAIAATDSLNVAIGKLEKALDEKQASGSYAPASHTSDAVAHITDNERAKWNAKSNLTLGTTSSTAFRGDQGLIAYDHSQVAHAPANAEQNVQADWNESNTGSDAYIKNKPTIPTVDVNKAYVDAGLAKKANATDLHSHDNKVALDTVTSEKIASWDAKSNFSGSYNDLTNKPTIPSISGLATESYVNTKVAGIVDSSPETLDTLKELSEALGNDPNFATTVTNLIGTKADSDHNHNTAYASKSSEHTHSNKAVLDGISSAKVTEWNNKSTFSGSYNDLTDKPQIPTPEQIQSWDNKVDKSELNNHKFWSGTQAEYDAIPNKDINTIYFVKKV